MVTILVIIIIIMIMFLSTFSSFLFLFINLIIILRIWILNRDNTMCILMKYLFICIQENMFKILF